MKLKELSPEWVEPSENEPRPSVEKYLDFRCPKCPDEPMHGYETMRCRIMIPVTTKREGPGSGWGWNGETDFDKVTLTPSIWHHCKSDPHFFITDGEVKMC